MSEKNRASGRERQFAILAGSGFQEFVKDSSGRSVETKYGRPSSPIRDIGYGDRTVYQLARHGDSMLIPPHKINYRANLKALQQLGVWYRHACIAA